MLEDARESNRENDIEQMKRKCMNLLWFQFKKKTSPSGVAYVPLTGAPVFDIVIACTNK